MTKIQRKALTLCIAHDIAGCLLHECGQQTAFDALMTELESETKKWVAELQRNGGTGMPAPHQRTRALIEAKAFLQELQDPKLTPRVPAAVREIARKLLHHYPSYSEVELAHKALPHLYGPVPPFSRAHARTAITDMGLDKIGSKK